MFFKAEIIVVGSEFFTRFKPDSNSLWLTEQLEKKGVRVVAKRTVADDLGALSAAFLDASRQVVWSSPPADWGPRWMTVLATPSLQPAGGNC